MISSETVDQVRAYPDIVAIISDYVTLKKRGRNYIGLCPFHQERSPSFTVSPEKQLWHCFGCHASGDHIGFVMKVDHLSFAEAIVHIANRVGISVVEVKSEAQSLKDDQRRKLLDELYAIRTQYEAQFPGSSAQDYLLGRGFSADILTRFHVGYANPTAEQARYRHRAMFPIMDSRGRTVGFGGRQLPPSSSGPKYINSDESLIFNKRQLLYGLDQAKGAIQKEKMAILVEGYLDVIAAHQFGFVHTVGTMGTALTHDHAQLLKRLTHQVTLVFDSDSAGQLAIDRSYEVLKPLDFHVFVAIFSQKDPADLLMTEGADAFATVLAEAKPILAYKIEQAHAQWQGRIEEVPELLNSVFQSLRQEQDSMVQRYYAKQISTLFKLETEWVLAKLKYVRYNATQEFFPKKDIKNKFQKAQNFLIYAMASDLTVRQQLLSELDPSDFHSSALHRSLFEFMCHSQSVGRELLLEVQDQPFSSLLSAILLEEESPEFFELHKEDYLQTVKSYRTDQNLNRLKVQISQAEAAGDEIEVNRLMESLRDLLKLDTE